MIELVNANSIQIPLRSGIFHCIVTSPPYFGLRAYGAGDGEIGAEPTPEEFIAALVQVGRECRRVLRDDGVMWLNLGDSYASDDKWGGSTGGKHVSGLHGDEGPGRRRTVTGLQSGDRMNIPHRVASALQADGWTWRSTVIWRKKSAMPESVDGWRWERCRVKVRASDRARGWKGEAHERPHGEYADNGRDFAKPDIWQDCPGCDKCRDTDGLVLRKGSWRPTSSHEYIFQMVKGMGYFGDREAAKREAKEASKARALRGVSPGHKNVNGAPGQTPHTLGQPREHGEGYPITGANPRDVMTFKATPFKGTGKRISRFRRVEPARATYGSVRITLPDCPVHSGSFDQDARELCGEHGDSLFRRSLDTYSHLVRAHAIGSFPMSENICPPGSNWRDHYRIYSPSAIEHNNPFHKMGLSLGSGPAYMPFFETAWSIERKSELLASFVRHLCIFGNNILSDDLPASLLPKIPHRIVRNSSELLPPGTSCTCLYYENYTTNADHYATFPTTLPEFFIKASTPEAGVCAECGAPWARVVGPRFTVHDGKTDSGYAEGMTANRLALLRQAARERGEEYSGQVDTLGFRRTCEHDAPAVPALVLDPFAGSGSTLIAARKLERRAVGLELNLDYILDVASERLGFNDLRRWREGAPAGRGGKVDDLPLFEGLPND